VIFTLEPVSGPDIEPVTLEEMKRDLGEFAGITARDTDISGLITGAREWAEDFTGCALVDQAWRLTVEQMAAPRRGVQWAADADWSRGGILLRRSPVLGITSFKTVDSSNTETDVDPTTYALVDADSKWPRIVALNGGTWTSGVFRIVLRAGYADRTGSPQQDASVIPQRFKTAIRLHVKAHYDADENMDRLVKAAEAMLKPLRTHLGFA
jgi:uncharacterized phiE125 gp8 family phage protein